MNSRRRSRLNPGFCLEGVLVLAMVFLFSETAIAVTEPASTVTFHLVARSTPVCPSLKAFSYELLVAAGTKDEIRTAEWEIREVTHHHLVARFPFVYQLGSGLNDERALQMEATWRNTFDDDQLRRIGDLGTGDYRIALQINGVRASNVVAFKIDPAWDAHKEPTLRVGMVEAAPGQSLGSLLVWIVGPTPQDAAFTNFVTAMASFTIDGATYRREMITWTGPVGPYPPGTTGVTIFNLTLPNYKIPADFIWTKPHDFRVQAGKYISDTVRLDLGSQVLAREWDQATASLTNTPAQVPLLTGIVHNEHGPLSGWEVRLKSDGPDPAYSELTDEKGRYAFAHIPPGKYVLYCSPAHLGTPNIERENLVLAAGETRTIDFGFEPTYSFSGHVLDSQRRGIAGLSVDSSWKDPATGTEYHTDRITRNDGSYELAGPFSVVSYVGLDSSVKNKPHPKYDVKPGAKDVDFILGP